MKQVKYVFHELKTLILHHKTISILICCAIILDISLIGVIADIQKKGLTIENHSFTNNKK